MTLHLVGIFHTVHAASWSHCAFTGKALRFPRMMQAQGFRVVEYSNGESESEAAEKVRMLAGEELVKMTGRPAATGIHALAEIGTRWHKEFERRLIRAMAARVEPGDIICHPFGHAHARLMTVFPDNLHVETGIGYPTTMGGSFRVFESYAWRHYHAGKAGRQSNSYEFVIPNYFDVREWEPSTAPGRYVAFLGRVAKCKGLDVVAEIAVRIGLPVRAAGDGDPSPWAGSGIEFIGPLAGRARSEFLRNAVCTLMPTDFIEPFGGSGVEGLLCGTPLIASDWGAFSETVVEGVNGFRPRTLREWLDAIEAAPDLDRAGIAAAARRRYSLETCGGQYARVFRQLAALASQGWYAGAAKPEPLFTRAAPPKGDCNTLSGRLQPRVDV